MMFCPQTFPLFVRSRRTHTRPVIGALLLAHQLTAEDRLILCGLGQNDDLTRRPVTLRLRTRRPNRRAGQHARDTTKKSAFHDQSLLRKIDQCASVAMQVCDHAQACPVDQR
jgi:hypothetical protein